MKDILFGKHRSGNALKLDMTDVVDMLHRLVWHAREGSCDPDVDTQRVPIGDEDPLANFEEDVFRGHEALFREPKGSVHASHRRKMLWKWRCGA